MIVVILIIKIKLNNNNKTNNDNTKSKLNTNLQVIEGLANEDNYQRLPCDMVDNENTTNNCNPENTNNNIVNNCIADSSTQNKEDFEENIGLGKYINSLFYEH